MPVKAQRGMDIRQPIPDPPRPRHVDVQRRLRLAKQLEARLATVARTADLRVVWAEVAGVDVRVVVGDEVLDTSVRGKLQQMRVALAA